MLDHFQSAQPGHHERVALDRSTGRDVVAILTEFVERAGHLSERERPLIAVSTAAARNPYAELARYRQLFEQAGADVVWLPLDAAVRRARSEENCLDLARYQALELGVHERRRVAPESFERQLVFCLDRNAGIELLAVIDGLFLNSGDADRLLQAFRDSAGRATAELEILRRRLSDRKIVLGGAGAGAMVQGDDALGFVPFALVATRFSERQGQIPLARMMIERGRRYGLGVDAASALFVERMPERADYSLQARGRGGAWVLDRGPDARASPPAGSPVTVALRRLAAGESMRFDPAGGLVAETPVIPTYDPDDCRAIAASVSFNELSDLARETAGRPVTCYRLPMGAGAHADWVLEAEDLALDRSFDSLLVIRTDSILAPAAPD